jgi:hypothetical protein
MTSPPAATTRPAPLAVAALALAVLALALAVFPGVGLAAAVVALVVSGLAWRQASRTGHSLGLAHTATGVALSVLAISAIWTVVAAVVPQRSEPALDCTRSDLSPADQIRCDEEIQP